MHMTNYFTVTSSVYGEGANFQHEHSERVLHDLLSTSVFELVNNTDLIHICKYPSGKPYVKVADDISSVAVSVSHKNNYIFVAASTSEKYIGVDVEEVRDLSTLLLDGFLTENEKNILGTLDVDIFTMYATKIWCIKESILKALGCGLTINPQKIDVSELVLLGTGFFGNAKIGNELLVCRIFYHEFKNSLCFIGLTIDTREDLLFRLGLPEW